MLQVEAKFGADLQLIKDIDIKGTGEIFKETQTEQNSRQALWLCKAPGTVCSVPQVKTISTGSTGLKKGANSASV